MRWFPYPTCRLPRRRLIASLLVACLLGAPGSALGSPLDDFSIKDPYCGKVSEAAGAKYRLDYTTNEDKTIKIPTDKGKQRLVFDRWRDVLKQITPTHHAKARSGSIAQSVVGLSELNIRLTGENHQPKGYLEQAVDVQEAYLEHLITGTAMVCEQVIRGEALTDANSLVLKVAPARGCDYTPSINLTQSAKATIAQEKADLENVLKRFDTNFKPAREANEKLVENIEKGRKPVDTGVDMAIDALDQEVDTLFAKKDAKTILERRDSFFGRILNRWELDKKTLEATDAQLTQDLTALRAKQVQCQSLGSYNGNPAAAPNEAQRTQPGQTAGPVSRNSTPRDCMPALGSVSADCALADAGAGTINTTPSPENTGATPGGPRPPGKIPDPSNDDDLTKRPPASGPPGNAQVPPLKNPEGPSFWEEHKTAILVTGGVGVAAVGGLLLYKHNEDIEKAKAERWSEIDQNVAMVAQQQQSDAAAGATATATETATATASSTYVDASTTDSFAGNNALAVSTPSGSTLLVSGVPASATAGQLLSAITVKIIGVSGVMSQDSNTDITVSCVSPTPCSLIGTTTVNTNNGRVDFTDLRFTSAQTGVKLQFSANGYATAVSNSTFNVSQ